MVNIECLISAEMVALAGIIMAPALCLKLCAAWSILGLGIKVYERCPGFGMKYLNISK